MQSLIKIPLLFTFLCINVLGFDYPQPNPYSAFRNSNFFSGMEKSKAELISDKYIKSGNDVYKINSVYYFFIDSSNKHEGFYFNGYFYFVDSSLKKAYCFWVDTSRNSYTRNCYPSPTPPAVEVEYRNAVEFFVQKIATCQSDENFNTDTQQCQKCSDGQSWDSQTNTCFNDCSKDGKINKVGLPDGRCIDCSGEKTALSVLQCICRGYGNSSIDPKIWGKNGGSPDGCQLEGSCGDGSIQYSFINPKCSVKPDPKPDDNKTKPDNPNPNPDNNKTNPGDPNNPNQGGNQGGNNGGNQGNPKPNPNPGNNTNPNPDPKPNPKPGNNDGNNNNDGDKNKDADAKFNPGDFDYSDLKRDEEQFTNKFKGALDDVLKDFDGFKQGVDQFISNVQGKGLASADKQSKPTTCIKKYDIDFFGYKSSIEFDFCKVASMVSGAFYYIFYAFFFYCFLILIVKILLFAF